MQFGQNLELDSRQHGPPASTMPILMLKERQAVKDLWKHTQSVVSKGRYGLVVLDELSLAMNYDLIATQHVVNFLQQRPPQVDVILTGPDMPEVLLNNGRPGNGISAKLFAVENTRRQYTNTPVKVV